MAGPVRLRFSAHLPANTPVHPRKPPPKSFVKKTLPVSHTCGRTCAQIPAILMKTRNFRVEGEGGVIGHSLILGIAALGIEVVPQSRAEQLQPLRLTQCNNLGIAAFLSRRGQDTSMTTTAPT